MYHNGNINGLINNYNLLNSQNYRLGNIAQLPFNLDLAKTEIFDNGIKLYDFTEKRYTDFSQVIPIILPIITMVVCAISFYSVLKPHTDYLLGKKNYINTEIYHPVFIQTPLGKIYPESKNGLQLYQRHGKEGEIMYQNGFAPLDSTEITILVSTTFFFLLMFFIFISKNLITRNKNASLQINLSKRFQLNDSYLLYYKNNKYISLPKT